MRAIDADAFKDYIRGACEDMKHLYKDNGAWAKEITESFCKDIDEQPTIQPEPHWIPVAERPDKSGDYLVTLIDGAEKWVEIVYWNETFGGNWQAVIGDEEYYSTIGNVIAWMPLPEPFKGVTT